MYRNLEIFLLKQLVIFPVFIRRIRKGAYVVSCVEHGTEEEKQPSLVKTLLTMLKIKLANPSPLIVT